MGINCSLGPAEILPVRKASVPGGPGGVPVFVKPNAGLPNPDGSYDLDAEGFAAAMQAYAASGVSIVGGCCGTTPGYIRRLKETFAPLVPAQKIPVRASRLCSPVRCVEVGGVTVVGERINPTGKKRLQQALREGDSAYACAQAVAQAEAGAELLDVNAGLPGIDEAATLERLVQQIQAVTDLPLQLDSTDPAALERALRVYNASRSSTRSTASRNRSIRFCRCAKSTVRPSSASRWTNTASRPRPRAAWPLRGASPPQPTPPVSPREDVYIDCLTLTVSASRTLRPKRCARWRCASANWACARCWACPTSVSGCPARGYMNTAFLTLAMQAGLDLAIMNPNTPEMMAAVRAYRVLTGRMRCAAYVEAYAGSSCRRWPLRLPHRGSPPPRHRAGTRWPKRSAAVSKPRPGRPRPRRSRPARRLTLSTAR